MKISQKPEKGSTFPHLIQSRFYISPSFVATAFCIATSVCATSVAWAQSPVTLNPSPTRVFGHAKRELTTATPNLVEGKELNGPSGVALDTSVTPPILYVADTFNNRVMVWKNARSSSGASADLVVGQRDFFTTFPQGPGTGFSSGLSSPSSVAVDKRGNLYVLDTGNNRILRYPKPLSQQGDFIQPDLVIGQTGLSAQNPNQGLATPNEKTLFSRSNSQIIRSRLIFDPDGNLWLADGGNNRVLRYNASVLTDSATNAPSADLVLGQLDFNSREPLLITRVDDNLNKTKFRVPSALAFDANGRLYVSDTNRVLVFQPPFRTGMEGLRVLGVYVNNGNKPPVNEFTITDAEGLFTSNNQLFAIDTATHRIVKFDPADSWQPESIAIPSPAAKAVYGQSDFLSFRENRDQRLPSGVSFSQPNDAVVFQSELWLADTGNNRVLCIPIVSNNLTDASRVLGQNAVNRNAANFVEGKELFIAANTQNLPLFGGTATLSSGVVTDQKSNPPRLYIADTYNNRVLAFADARKVKSGDVADLVIGQADFFTTAPNSPTFDSNQPSDTGLFQPVGLAVDANGNLFIADSLNGRVVRYPNPFLAQSQGRAQQANLVIGQSGFNFKIQDVTRTNLGRPLGVTLTVDGHLVVADSQYNRVLLYKKLATGDFTNGMAAITVLGQRDFTTAAPGNGDDKLNTPHHLSVDSDDRLYVADTGNSRIAIFNSILQSSNGSSPVFSIGSIGPNDRIRNPQGIWVSDKTGEIWVADTPNGRAVRFPKFDNLVVNPVANYTLPMPAQPLSLTLDPLGNLLIADSANRVVFHFPSVVGLSAAHYLSRPLSPGLIVSLYPQGVKFGDTQKIFSGYPLPKELADIEVLVDGVAAPLYFVDPAQINFYIPMGAPTSGTSEFIVQKKSVQQVLASAVIAMAPATPGFFTTAQSGRGPIASINEDGTINSASNQIARKGIISLYGTGQGLVPNAPPDGVAATGQTPSAVKPRVFVGTDELSGDDVLYSGLAPGFVGLWQLNIRIPDKVLPGPTVQVAVIVNNIPSTQSSNGQVIVTTISVKQ